MDIFSNLAIGLQAAFSVTNLIHCFVGVLLGTLIGVIPGVGTLAAISMLFPLTFHLEPTTALIMLGGIWYGTAYGGSIASILLNIPGTPSSAVTCLDGYPMARQGRGGIALFMTTIASFIGGSIGIVLLMMFAPVISTYALKFGSAEYFALMVLGLVAATTISDGSAIKGLAMVVLGIFFGTIGMDSQSAATRFTFGIMELLDGMSMIALAMGIFGVTEVIFSVRRIKIGEIDPATVRFSAMRPTKDDWKRSIMPILRGSGIGSFFGTLPGTGPSIASFISYAVEKRVAKEPQRFGKGAIEGVASPEAANNAADQTAYIPTLSLGIPGSATMALMIGALMVHGIAPGPSLISNHPDLFWGLVMSFWIGNVLLVILNIPMIGIWVRLLTIPYHLLYPAIVTFICIGAYSIGNNAVDVWLVLFFGALGYFMRIFGMPAAPLLLGFVLGPLMEEHFRRALVMSRGSFSVFVERPISLTILILTAMILGFTLWKSYEGRFRKDRSKADASA